MDYESVGRHRRSNAHAQNVLTGESNAPTPDQHPQKLVIDRNCNATLPANNEFNSHIQGAVQLHLYKISKPPQLQKK